MGASSYKAIKLKFPYKSKVHFVSYRANIQEDINKDIYTRMT